MPALANLPVDMAPRPGKSLKSCSFVQNYGIKPQRISRRQNGHGVVRPMGAAHAKTEFCVPVTKPRHNLHGQCGLC
jgi:hypothetical protein